MGAFQLELQTELAEIEGKGLLRRLRELSSPQQPHIQLEGKAVLNFSSNDYLGLSQEKAVRDGGIDALKRYGTGAGASRLICGSLKLHHDLEEKLARLKGCQAAISFSSGYAAALGVIGSLVGAGDTVILDKLCHASLVDGARLSGATIRVFRHGDLNSLERILSAVTRRNPGDARRSSRCLVITESIFSMDGDHAPLAELAEMKARHGAWLMVDEAHATGLYGERGAGLAEFFKVSDQVEVHMGTLGKALGTEGGFICGSRQLIDLIINRARSFIFSTAPSPATVAASSAAVDFVRSANGMERRRTLWTRAGEIGEKLGVQTQVVPRAIQPIMVGEEMEAVRLSRELLELGIYIPAIRYPSVPRKKARLRLTVTAKHSAEDIAQLSGALRQLGIDKGKT